MDGKARRIQILEKIKESSKPVSASKLAALYGVSRQVVVQDIALIRAAGQRENINESRIYTERALPDSAAYLKSATLRNRWRMS